mmetsp:Transcript_9110/g.23849  ORF Transcript_9110/g.23849 Transcript_9110/m.23849 type:complete len:227 (-) Transcript_9110:2685-3365(-)
MLLCIVSTILFADVKSSHASCQSQSVGSSKPNCKDELVSAVYGLHFRMLFLAAPLWIQRSARGLGRKHRYLGFGRGTAVTADKAGRAHVNHRSHGFAVCGRLSSRWVAEDGEDAVIDDDTHGRGEVDHVGDAWSLSLSARGEQRDQEEVVQLQRHREEDGDEGDHEAERKLLREQETARAALERKLRRRDNALEAIDAWAEEEEPRGETELQRDDDDEETLRSRLE